MFPAPWSWLLPKSSSQQARARVGHALTKNFRVGGEADDAMPLHHRPDVRRTVVLATPLS
jgi:hypothetical protein